MILFLNSDILDLNVNPLNSVSVIISWFEFIAAASCQVLAGARF